MISLLSVVAIGFVLGIAHAADPDHVIAVTTIVDREGSLRRAAWVGLAWGIGHTLTMLAVGSAVILLGVVIPARLELSMELSVALMLVLLGVASVARFRRELPGAAGPGHVHSHPHLHGDYIHTHSHGHGPDEHTHGEDETPLARLDGRLGRAGLYRLLRPVVVGVVHGLAGSAAVALLIMATIPHSRWAVVYLLVFGAGTIAGMTLFTVAVTSASIRLRMRYRGFSRWMGVGSGFVAVVFGLFMAWRLLG